MRRVIRAVLGPAAVLTLLLTSLSVAAPVLNAQDAAPRSVFLRLPDTVPEPTVALQVTPLADGRWRLRLDTEHFQFTEVCLAEAEAIPVGHGHVLLNGVKLASAYQPVVDLGPLPPGRHEVRVVLRGQDHRALLGEDGLIEAQVSVVVE